MGTTRRDRMKGGEIPGTTPLVAIALIDIAVNIVCKEEETKAEFNTFQELPFFPPHPVYWHVGPQILTQQQHIKTMQRPCSTPAVPTTQVNRKNRITPKMFCRQGR